MTFQEPQQQQPPAPQNGVTDTGSGFLVGVQPAQARMTGDWVQQNGQTAVQEQPQQQQPQGQRLFTAEEVEAFRQQEKDKLYGRLDEMGTQLQSVLEERQQEQAEKQRLAEEAEAARRAKEESELDLRSLIEKRDQEWTERLAQVEQQSAAERALFQKERQLQEVEGYRRQRLEQEEQYIDPALRDLVAGNTPEEVDSSIAFMRERSEIIAANYAAAAQQAQAPVVPFRGAAMPSVPPVGPLEQLPSTQPITQEFLDSMDMDTYKRHREQLLRMTNPNRRQG